MVQKHWIDLKLDAGSAPNVQQQRSSEHILNNVFCLQIVNMRNPSKSSDVQHFAIRLRAAERHTIVTRPTAVWWSALPSQPCHPRRERFCTQRRG